MACVLGLVIYGGMEMIKKLILVLPLYFMIFCSHVHAVDFLFDWQTTLSRRDSVKMAAECIISKIPSDKLSASEKARYIEIMTDDFNKGLAIYPAGLSRKFSSPEGKGKINIIFKNKSLPECTYENSD